MCPGALYRQGPCTSLAVASTRARRMRASGAAAGSSSRLRRSCAAPAAAAATVPALLVAALFVHLCGAGARTLPPYERGQGKYQWLLTEVERERGVTYIGPMERLRGKMAEMLGGKPTKVALIGGSITAGHAIVDGPSWVQYLTNYMADHYGDKLVVHNGAVPGTGSTYMVVCHNMHVPRDADIILMEYAVNEYADASPTSRPRQNEEQLLRKLLDYPNKPAVVSLHAYAADRGGFFWGTAELQLTEFGMYYSTPQLSVRNCCYRMMLANESGFVMKSRADGNLKGVAFFADAAHPDGLTGHRVMGELAIHLFVKAIKSVQASPVSAEETAAAAAPNPPPMIPGNYESAVDRCFVGGQFQKTVAGVDAAWNWTNEGRKGKWGYVSTTPGSAIRLKVDTRSFSNTSDREHTGPNTVELAYLRSYAHMGQARIACESGCTCSEQQIDGHWTDKHSQLTLHRFPATQAEQCVVAVTVLPASSSGENKVKLAGIMVVEHGVTADDDWGKFRNGAVMTAQEISTEGAEAHNVRL